MGKRPAYQFFPGDEERDIALRLVGLHAFGLWRRMLNLMHEGVPYGHLCTPSGEPIEPVQLAQLVGEKAAVVRRLLTKLEAHHVFSRTETGVIFCRRMVRDGHISEVRAAAGRRGGNPALTRKPAADVPDLVKQTAKQTAKQSGKQTGKQIPTPSSSPSTSTSVTPPPQENIAARADAGAAEEPAAGGGGRLFAARGSEQTGTATAPDEGLHPNVRARIDEIAARRVASGEARGGLAGSRSWCVKSYQGRGEVFEEIHGAQTGAGREALRRLGVELPGHLAAEVVGRVERWAQDHESEAEELLQRVQEECGPFHADQVGAKFALRVGEHLKAGEHATGGGTADLALPPHPASPGSDARRDAGGRRFVAEMTERALGGGAVA